MRRNAALVLFIFAAILVFGYFVYPSRNAPSIEDFKKLRIEAGGKDIPAQSEKDKVRPPMIGLEAWNKWIKEVSEPSDYTITKTDLNLLLNTIRELLFVSANDSKLISLSTPPKKAVFKTVDGQSKLISDAKAAQPAVYESINMADRKKFFSEAGWAHYNEYVNAQRAKLSKYNNANMAFSSILIEKKRETALTEKR